ncbi:hypothetical protein [Streptomyces sp. NPDC055085]
MIIAVIFATCFIASLVMSFAAHYVARKLVEKRFRRIHEELSAEFFCPNKVDTEAAASESPE